MWPTKLLTAEFYSSQKMWTNKVASPATRDDNLGVSHSKEILSLMPASVDFLEQGCKMVQMLTTLSLHRKQLQRK